MNGCPLASGLSRFMAMPQDDRDMYSEVVSALGTVNKPGVIPPEREQGSNRSNLITSRSKDNNISNSSACWLRKELRGQAGVK